MYVDFAEEIKNASFDTKHVCMYIPKPFAMKKLTLNGEVGQEKVPKPFAMKKAALNGEVSGLERYRSRLRRRNPHSNVEVRTRKGWRLHSRAVGVPGSARLPPISRACARPCVYCAYMLSALHKQVKQACVIFHLNT